MTWRVAHVPYSNASTCCSSAGTGSRRRSRTAPTVNGPRRSACRPAYRDVHYRPYGVIVELDGRPFHDTSLARDQDAWRDLEAKVGEEATTIRLTYGLVFRNGCRTIRQVATLLERQGWTGTFTSCPECGA